MQSQIFLTDDPALVVMYSHLRQQTLQTLHGASQVSPRTEWEFVLHSARIYDRMGCDLLGLDLGEFVYDLKSALGQRTNVEVVRNWHFLRHSSSLSAILEKSASPSALLRRRSSVVIADMALGSGRQNKHQAPETTDDTHRAQLSHREEPDVNSFLDSFGF